jgi:penicillin-binding protein 1C
MSPSAAVQVLDILSDPVARIPGFGLETPFDFPFRAAAKSGTSRHFTDNWAVAVTGNFTVATWAGNFSGRPMDGVSGVSGAGPLLHRSVLLTARRYPPGDLPTPSHAGLVPVVICRLSGARAQADCPQTIEWFVPGTEPDRPCVWHRNGRAELPAEFAEWRETDGVGSAEATATRAVPSEAAAPLSSSFRIISPQNGDQYRAAPGVDTRYATLALRASGAPAGARVDWFIDGRPVSVRRWRIVPGRHAVEARTHDGLRDRVEIEVD